MLDVQNVTKTFDGFKALNDLSMTVPKGAVYGLVGPNGAGKSTVIRCIVGTYCPDCGSITLDGQPIYENPTVKARIGSIPDEIFYFPSATLEDMKKYYKGIYPSFDDALFEKLYEAFQLPKKTQIRRFSKGMQKQAAFHLTLCQRPDFLVLDEPVDGLDPVMRRQVMSLILSEVAQNETTVEVRKKGAKRVERVVERECAYVADFVYYENGQKATFFGLNRRKTAKICKKPHKTHQNALSKREGVHICHQMRSKEMRTWQKI